MEQREFLKLLNFFDTYFWDRKVTETNWNYNGLVLDYNFSNSKFNEEYLDIEDFFRINGDFDYVETEMLEEQFKELDINKRLKLIENILTILENSTVEIDQSQMIINKSIQFLSRHNIVINKTPENRLKLSYSNIIDSGSYCLIKKMKDGVLKKELRPSFKDDEKLQKRMKYEFENMSKLHDCPQVLNVYTFDKETHSYLMEEAEKNLYDYLNDEITITFEQKLRIILDIMQGMKCAHNNTIIHRDLHLGNILKIKKNFVICDFGLSKDESVVRSLKSSPTEKNNHFFLDPIAIGDFTKLDLKSDIYSIGKIIDYILSYNDDTDEHIFTFIVEKSMNRDKRKRYDNIDEMLNDIILKLKENNNNFNKTQVIENIRNCVFNVNEDEYIKNLVSEKKLCPFIVKHRLSTFGKTILQFNTVDQVSILTNIQEDYIGSTGYGQFQNYDIFANISYYVCKNTGESKVYSLAYNILKGCAHYRYQADNYLKELEEPS